MKLRCLLVGFSVTAQGFGEKLKSKIEILHTNIVFEHVALGGCHPSGLVYLIDQILTRRNCDIIIFEIFTSAFRNNASDLTSAVSPFYILSQKAIHRGLKVIFLNLPRRDVNPFHDSISDHVRLSIGRTGAKFLDISALAYNHFSKDFMWQHFFLRDGFDAHPTAENEEWLVDQAASKLADCLKIPNENPHPLNEHLPVLSSVEFSSISTGETVEFTRHNFCITCLELKGGEEISLKFDETYICGISYLSWPRAGTIILRGNDFDIDIQCFDQWSYYDRLSYKLFSPVKTGTLSVYQHSAIPSVALIKGVKSTEARIGLLATIFTTSNPYYDIDEIKNVHAS